MVVGVAGQGAGLGRVRLAGGQRLGVLAAGQPDLGAVPAQPLDLDGGGGGREEDGGADAVGAGRPGAGEPGVAAGGDGHARLGQGAGLAVGGDEVGGAPGLETPGELGELQGGVDPAGGRRTGCAEVERGDGDGPDLARDPLGGGLDIVVDEGVGHGAAPGCGGGRADAGRVVGHGAGRASGPVTGPGAGPRFWHAATTSRPAPSCEDAASAAP